MIPLTHYQNKKIGVFGLGLSGQATIGALLAGGAEVWAWDDKAESVILAQAAHNQAKYYDFGEWPWKQIEMLVLSPGVPLNYPQPHLVVKAAAIHGCRIVGDIELLAEACPEAVFIGITGTNGKSTTTALVAHILKQAERECEVGGNLGTPALSLRPLGKEGVYVLEMSSYQLDLLSSAVFNIAVLLNITPDHIDRHGSMEGYITAKTRIFQGQRSTDTAIIGIDSPLCRDIYKNLKEGRNRYTWQGKGPKLVPFSTKKPLPEGIAVERGVIQGKVNITQAQALLGEHNWQNAAAAYAVTHALEIPDLTIERAMHNFPGLDHRMKLAGKIGEVKFVNDSKATNAEATENALRAFDDIYWILGGKPKEGGINSLLSYFPKIAKAYLIGEAAKEFGAVLKQHQVAHQQCGTLDQAFEVAATDALKAGKGVVLLSPACASFDQFKSFEHRGQVFCELVSKRIKRDKLEKVHDKIAAG